MTRPGLKIDAAANLSVKRKSTLASIFVAMAGANLMVFEVDVEGEFTKNIIYVDRARARELAEYILEHA